MLSTAAMKITRPIFQGHAAAFTTKRLLLRPMIAEDLNDLHKLRTEPEVMINTSTGKVDPDHDATQSWMNRFLSPNDSATFQFAVEELCHPGIVIGCIGSHIAEPPTLGYMFRKDKWGIGYATEAAQGWLSTYWNLPRYEVEVQNTMPEVSELRWQGDFVREVVIAQVEAGNTSSLKVMEKCGFIKTGVEQNVEDFRGPAVLVHCYLERPYI